MGDSITEGFGLSATENYPYRLGEMLGEAYEVINKGICCCTALDVEWNGEAMGMAYARQERYKEALREKGDIYVVLLGTNDAQDGLDDVEDIKNPLQDMIGRKADFAGCYQELLNGIKKAAPKARIFIGIPAPVMQCIWRRHQEKYLRELFPCYEELLAANPDVKKIDIHAAFCALPEESRRLLYQEDGLHPNAKGAERIAETVFRGLTLAEQCAIKSINR